MTQLTSRRPYLIRAMHEWMSDNFQTPHIVVDATVSGVNVPEKQVQNGKIVLNISNLATAKLDLANESIKFDTRFDGVPFSVTVPVEAVLGIYARETGQGMIFSGETTPQPPDDDSPTPEGSKRPRLKVVK